MQTPPTILTFQGRLYDLEPPYNVGKHMPELVINVSNFISPLCYTVLRLEPYTTCPFKCVYCYARWYMKSPTNIVYPRYKALDMFRSFVKKVYRRGLKPIPFRLSTLVDPFPPHEQLYRFSEKMLSVASDYEYPLIINTKSVYFAYDPIKKYLLGLLDKRLAILQISVSVLRESVARVLEPVAPDPIKRLDAVKELGSTDVPIAIRLSPFIPFASPSTREDIEQFALLAKEVGVKHVIVETIRFESSGIGDLLRRLGITNIVFEGYSIREVDGLKPVSRASLKIVEGIYHILSRELEKHGIAFATCKEGLFDFHTASDCCGAYLLRDAAIRLTLYDVYRHVVESGTKSTSFSQEIDLLRDVSKRYSRLFGDDVSVYPREVSKPLKNHEKKLVRVLRNRELLSHVAPHLARRILSS